MTAVDNTFLCTKLLATTTDAGHATTHHSVLRARVVLAKLQDVLAEQKDQGSIN